MDKVSVDLRPDNCKIIFEKLSDHLFLGTQDPRFKPTKVAQQQVAAFNQQGFSVIIVTPNQGHAIFVAQGHDENQIRQEYQSILGQRYGNLRT